MAAEQRKRASSAPGGSGFRPAARTDYVLRTDGREFVVDRPRLIIGRATASDIQLDGASVSRRHAVVSRTDEGLSIEDLGSRNGVFINGTLIARPFRLEEGDFIRVGDHDIEVGRVGVPEPAEPVPEDDVDEDELSTRRVDPLQVLGGIFDHALARGDYEEAEAVVGGHLRALRAASRAGKSVHSRMLHEASRYALRLAESSGRGAWIDYVIELHLNLERTLPLRFVRELFRLAPVARYQDHALLRRYLELLQTPKPTLGPDVPLVLERMRRYGRL